MAQNTGHNFKKTTSAFPEENKLLAGDFRGNLDETNTDIVQFMKRWNWKWIVKHQGYFCRKFAAINVSSAPKYKHLPVFKAGLSSSYDGCARCKGKVSDLSGPNQNVETTCNSKLTFT